MVLMGKFPLACRSDAQLNRTVCPQPLPWSPYRSLCSALHFRHFVPRTLKPSNSLHSLAKLHFYPPPPYRAAQPYALLFKISSPPTSPISPNAAKPLFNPICSPFVPRNAEWTIRLPIRFRWLLARMTCLESLLWCKKRSTGKKRRQKRRPVGG